MDLAMIEQHGLLLATERDMDAPESPALSLGRAVVFTRGWGHVNPDAEAHANEDAFLVLSAPDDRVLLAVADGLGGHAGGAQAARTALEMLAGHATEALTTGADLREAILNGFESANAAVRDLRLDAGTTLVVAEIDGKTLRTYHAGDSAILAVGQRGRIKTMTVAHSPVGYAVEAGMLDAKAAMHHADRHIVSNLIGTDSMRIEMGPSIKLAARDTVLLASDGLFDNLHTHEIVQIIRKGAMTRAAETLRTRTEARMAGEQPPHHPSKPDDLTFVLFRMKSAS